MSAQKCTAEAKPRETVTSVLALQPASPSAMQALLFLLESSVSLSAKTFVFFCLNHPHTKINSQNSWGFGTSRFVVGSERCVFYEGGEWRWGFHPSSHGVFIPTKKSPRGAEWPAILLIEHFFFLRFRSVPTRTTRRKQMKNASRGRNFLSELCFF